MPRILAYVLLGLLAACTTASPPHEISARPECPEIYNGCFSD